jgi:hypothetical protein
MKRSSVYADVGARAAHGVDVDQARGAARINLPARESSVARMARLFGGRRGNTASLAPALVCSIDLRQALSDMKKPGTMFRAGP